MTATSTINHFKPRPRNEAVAKGVALRQSYIVLARAGTHSAYASRLPQAQYAYVKFSF